MSAFRLFNQKQREDGLYVNPHRTSPTVRSPPTQESQAIMASALEYHGIRECQSLVSGLMEQIRRITATHKLGHANDQVPTVGVPVDPCQFVLQDALHVLARLCRVSQTASQTTTCLSGSVSHFYRLPFRYRPYNKSAALHTKLDAWSLRILRTPCRRSSGPSPGD